MLSIGTISYAGVSADGSMNSDVDANALSDSDLDNIFLRGQRCALMVNTAEPATQFMIEFWPGGKISGSICDAPNWQVTGINVNKPAKTGSLSASHIGAGSCASTMDLVVTSVTPGPVLHGTYGFNGASTTWPIEMTEIACNF